MNVLIYGAGLIGGSIAKALSEKGGHNVYVVNRTQLSYSGITFVESVELIKNINFDIICVATPRGIHYEIYQDVFSKIKNLTTKFIIDCSSVQGQNEYLRGYFRGKFIPCHPIAGSEKTGFHNSDSNILKGKQCIVIGKNPPQEVLNFWDICQMQTNTIDTTQEHDTIYAAVSHIPQLIAFFLPEAREPYTEFYRLKNSSRIIWEEIFFHNMDRILSILSVHLRLLQMFHEKNLHDGTMINNGDMIENIIGNMLYNGNRGHDNIQFAGSGFKTMTMFKDENSDRLYKSDTSQVMEILENAYDYLLNIKDKYKISSINIE